MSARSEVNTGPAPARLTVLVRRAFEEFMVLPAAILGGFVVLAVVTLLLDSLDAGWLRAGREFVSRLMFRTEQGTADLLATILSGLLTVISITFSVLLLAVQQTAGTLTNQVYDQFLRRRINQLYFGYTVGLAAYTLIVLAAADKGFNPVYSAACAVVLTVMCLALLVLLVYGTIDQMRPSVIVQSMHDHILKARDRQRELVRRTRTDPSSPHPERAEVRAEADGFVAGIDLHKLEGPLKEAGGAEVVIAVPAGTYAARGDRLAGIRAADAAAAEKLVPVVRAALRLEPERDLTCDPAWGLVELEAIGWTTTSSAKSTPEPPRLVMNALRDLLTRWADTEYPADPPDPDVLPVVYPDNTFRRGLDALTTLAAGAKESYQHTVMADALLAFGMLYERVPDPVREWVADCVRRVIPALRPLVLTRCLEDALTWLADTLRRHGERRVAGELDAARDELAKLVGRLPPLAGG